MPKTLVEWLALGVFGVITAITLSCLGLLVWGIHALCMSPTVQTWLGY